ncbi:hypothetical protein BYT27DRAFT_6453682 [Phlegmacium glaucopus]|nr:hypothetical protein BYT27DRAFT_6453682 [Phlegmacium glaucopus]
MVYILQDTFSTFKRTTDIWERFSCRIHIACSRGSGEEDRRWCRRGIHEELQDDYKEVAVKDRDNDIPCASHNLDEVDIVSLLAFVVEVALLNEDDSFRVQLVMDLEMPAYYEEISSKTALVGFDLNY